MKNKVGLLIAHGSRSESWKQPFLKIKKMCENKLPNYKWELSFLEYTSPSLNDSAAQLANSEENCDEVHLFPLFFAEGKHVKIDIPEFYAKAKDMYPDIRWILHDTVGTQTLIHEAMVSFMQEELNI